MILMKTVIIGGVAGGATTAARLRRRDDSAEIIIMEKGAYISYANCGLPYYIGDTIPERESLLLQTPEAMKSKFNIEVRIHNEVVEILPNDKKVRVWNHQTDEKYEESYDNLVIATGSSPLKPPIPGIDADNIFQLWTIPDTDAIKNYIQTHHPKKAAVIGGGFIGLEMAENLHAAGLSVSLIEMQNQVMAPLDLEMANLIHENLIMNQVELILEDGVKEFHQQENKTQIELNSGKIIEADMIILSIGIRPNSQLAKDAQLLLNKRGGIVVNEYLETSQPDIYAVGDVIEVKNLIHQEPTMIPLAGPANKQARILADNLVGDHKIYKGSLGTAVAKVFDLTAASVGLNEKQCQATGQKRGQDYETIIINQKSHAGYYPGATPLTLKMIFTREGKILGGQIVGVDGADKRIDTLASTIRLGGSIYDLAELELAYAPPYSSAKDPVNMLGFVAENVIRHMVSFLYPSDIDEIMEDIDRQKEIIVLDVTEDVERMVFAIPGSEHIPLGQLRDRMQELDKNKWIIPYCAVGVRSYNAARMLSANGFERVSVLAGGTAFYKSMHYKDRNNTAMVQQENQMNSEDTACAEDISKEIRLIDCCGLQCPGPIMRVNKEMTDLKEKEMIRVKATDMGFAADIDAWCRRTGNTLVAKQRVGKENIVTIQKGRADCKVPGAVHSADGCCQSQQSSEVSLPQGKTLIVFSGDLDKVLASFIIANGARAMGRPVTMFFTFWGLNALRKADPVPVKKSMIEKMFGKMMPRGSQKLKLSKMNMGGMGTAMMKKVMKDKNVESLEELMKHAMDSGIKLVACTMSMDIMGITKEELLDGVEYAGVATYLGDAEESNVNLFI